MEKAAAEFNVPDNRLMAIRRYPPQGRDHPRWEHVSGVADGRPAAQNTTSQFTRPAPFRPEALRGAAICA
jgi:hypothetical protein